MEITPASRSRKAILVWLIVSQLLALACLVFWLLVAGLSVMAFDSGVTQEAWNFVIAVWSYPICRPCLPSPRGSPMGAERTGWQTC